MVVLIQAKLQIAEVLVGVVLQVLVDKLNLELVELVVRVILEEVLALMLQVVVVVQQELEAKQVDRAEAVEEAEQHS